MKIQRSELIAQSQSGNKSFNGLDGKGSHADIYIEDAPTRIELGYETKNRKQLIFTDELVKNIFSIKDQDEFEKKFKEAFVTILEKMAVMDAINRVGINDNSKIRFAETYTGLKVPEKEQG
jgi:hypothetical protein